MRVFQTIKPFMIWSFMALIFYYSCQRTSTEPQNDINHEPTITINEPPVISSITASPDPVQLGKTTTITCNASDPNDDSLSYTWGVSWVSLDQTDSNYIFDWDVDVGSLTSSGATAGWTAPLAEGLYVVLCKITDIAGNNDVSLLEINVVSTGCLSARTDKFFYELGDTIVCNIENNTDSMVYFLYDLGTLPLFGIDKKVDDRWENGILIMLEPHIIELLPGNVLMDTLVGLFRYPRHIGTYRFNIPYGHERTIALSDSLLSNTFYVQ
jgi:hypothetical protein